MEVVEMGLKEMGLRQKDAQYRVEWQRRLKGGQDNPGEPGNRAVKLYCRYSNYMNRKFCFLAPAMSSFHMSNRHMSKYPYNKGMGRDDAREDSTSTARQRQVETSCPLCRPSS